MVKHQIAAKIARFSFLIDLELFIRSFAQGIWGISHQRLGPLPNLWQHREALRRLELMPGVEKLMNSTLW